MGKAKVTLDTNILISALGWSGAPRKALEKAVNGDIALVTSEEQFRELSRALDYPKLHFTEEQKGRFKSLVLSIATLAKPVEKLSVVKKDPDDNMVLECAIAGKADYIVTGDPHLLEIGEFLGVKIVTAKEFLEAL